MTSWLEQREESETCAMSRTNGHGAPFYKLRHVAREELRADDDLFGRIFRGELNGVIVRGVLPEERAAAIVRRLEAGDVRAPRRRFAREFEAYSIGPCLDQAEHGVDAYFEAVPAFTEEVRALLDEPTSEAGTPERAPSDRRAGDTGGDRAGGAIEAVLGVIAGGREVGLPRDASGRPYGRSSLRCLPPGGLIPPHCENEQLLRTPYEHLRTLIDQAALISYYLTLAPAEEGGELAIHALGWHELDRSAMRAGHSQVGDALETRAHVAVKPLAGELIVFDGGRYFHQVRPVRGARNRWTMGGFMARSADGRGVLAWA